MPAPHTAGNSHIKSCEEGLAAQDSQNVPYHTFLRGQVGQRGASWERTGEAHLQDTLTKAIV